MLLVNVFPLFFYVCFVQRVVGVRALSNSTDPPKEKTKDQGKKEMHISHLQQSISQAFSLSVTYTVQGGNPERFSWMMHYRDGPKKFNFVHQISSHCETHMGGHETCLSQVLD